MFGFFNKKNKLNASLQAVNLLALSLATYDLLANPEANASQLGIDIAVHSLNILGLKENSHLLILVLNSYFNVFRCGALYGDTSSIHPLIKSVDAGLHFATVLACISGMKEKADEQSRYNNMV